jgi:hypothetical protein
MVQKREEQTKPVIISKEHLHKIMQKYDFLIAAGVNK